MDSYITEYEKRLKDILKNKRHVVPVVSLQNSSSVKRKIYEFLPSFEQKKPKPAPRETVVDLIAPAEKESDSTEEEPLSGFITEEEVSILSRTGTQYNDTVINCFVDLLQAEQLRYFGYNPDRGLSWKNLKRKIIQPKIVVLFTTFLYEHIKTGTKKDALGHCKSHLRNVDLNQACTVVFPINLGNYHWVVVVLNKNQMTYYDSLNWQDTETAHECMTNVETFMSWYKGFEQPQVLYRRKVYTHQHPQKDNCSCGVYVCHRMLTAAEHRLDEELVNVNQFRGYLKKKLT